MLFTELTIPWPKAVMPDHIKPLALVSLRSIIAAILFWITSLFLPREKVSKKDLLYLFGCSFFGVVINQILFLAGLNLTSPINSSILISTNPIFAFVFAAIILREKITLLKGSGLAIGLAGVLILILQNGTPDVSSSTFVGDVITLINTISWAFYTVIIKKMLEKYHPVTVMKWTFLVWDADNCPGRIWSVEHYGLVSNTFKWIFLELPLSWSLQLTLVTSLSHSD